MKTLLIGGCGYIGSALYPYLQEFNPVSLDLEWFGKTHDNLKMDFDTLSKSFLSDFDVIILLAGYSSVQMCINRQDTFKNNVINFVNLLDKIDKQKFIYASSSSVYGTNKYISKEDISLPLPQNYYDLSKQEIDKYAILSNIEYYGLRFGTVNGYSPNLRDDIMINKMIKNINNLNIFNKNIYRPILGIKDLCRAIKSIILCKENKKGIYNLASFNKQVYQIAEAINPNYKDLGNTPCYDFRISCKKFQKTFNFKFEESIDSIVESLKSTPLISGSRYV